MAREFTNGVDQALESADEFAGPTGAFSSSVWVKLNTFTGGGVLHSLRDGNSFGYWQNRESNANDGDVNFQIMSGNSSIIGRVTAADAIAVNIWSHVGGSWDGGTVSSGINIYVDGIKVDNADSESLPFTGPSTSTNFWRVGAMRTGLTTQPDGHLAEPAIWNVELVLNDFKMLAAGVSPNRVRRDGLIGYSPVYGASDPEPDLSGNGHNLSVLDTVNQSNHPPVAPPFGFDVDMGGPVVVAAAGRIMSSLVNKGGLAGAGGIAGEGGGLAG